MMCGEVSISLVCTKLFISWVMKENKTKQSEVVDFVLRNYLHLYNIMWLVFYVSDDQFVFGLFYILFKK